MAKVLTKWSGNMLLALSVLVVAFILVTTVFLGWQFKTVLSGSMDPTLRVGGVVVTQPVDPEAIKVGDIISYYSPDHQKLMVHRVIEKRPGGQLGFSTQGDANADPDPHPIPAQNVVGKVGFHIPFLGYASQAVRSPLGSTLLLALPGLLFIAIGIKNIRTELSTLRGSRRVTETAWNPTAMGSWSTGLRSEDWTSLDDS